MSPAPFRTSAAILSAFVILASACGEERGPSPRQTPETPQRPNGEDHDDHGAVPQSPTTRTMYVPAYSHLTSGTDRRMLLAILLSVRNIDPTSAVTLSQVEYFDTSGHRLRRYLPAPRTLEPLETAEFSVDPLDESGGSGANFLVYWEAAESAHPLLTEAIMFGHVGSGYMSFTSRGVELARPPAPTIAPEPSAGQDAPEPSPSATAPE